MGHEPRAFRFGVAGDNPRPLYEPSERPKASSFVEFARKAEGLGFSTITFADHYVMGNLSPLPAAMAAAAATTSLRIGTQFLCNEFRHPVQLAREAATIDLLSDGRLELGIGAGWLAEDFERAGMVRHPAGVRIARLGETVEIVRGLWREEPFAFHGDHYNIDGLNALPKPVQQPPPITIGGGGRKILTLAAQRADIIGVNFTIPDDHAPGTQGALNIGDAMPAQIDTKIGWIKEGAGERFEGIELSMVPQHQRVTNDVRQTAEELSPRLRLSVDEVIRSPQILIGSVDAICERLLETRERWGITYIKVFPPIDDFAKVVERLA